MKPPSKLTQRQIERRLAVLRSALEAARVQPSWVTYIRLALGMSQRDLAKAAKISLSSVGQIERREANGAVTLATLRKLAHAIDCEFVYGIVPRQPVADLLLGKAIAKAKRIITAANAQMELEDQGVTSSFDERVQLLAEKLLDSGDVW